MRLRSRDTEYHDEGKRALGTAAFLGELKTFLDARVEGDGDGWAPVTQEDYSALHDLIFRLIALKWGTDADGDLPINFDTVDRNKGRLVSTTVPYFAYRDQDRPDYSQPDLEYVEQAGRAAAYLMAEAKTLMDGVNEHMRGVQLNQREAREKLEKLETFIETVNGRTDETNFNDDCEAAFELSRKVFAEDEKNQKRVMEVMATKYPVMLAYTIDAVRTSMAPFTSDNEPDYHEKVRQPRSKAYYVFGTAFLNDPEINRKSVELTRQGKKERDERRSARAKVV